MPERKARVGGRESARWTGRDDHDFGAEGTQVVCRHPREDTASGWGAWAGEEGGKFCSSPSLFLTIYQGRFASSKV